jgi:protein O-GlcNAc transferase
MSRYGRAQGLHLTNRITEAVAEYDQFLALEPKHLGAHSNRLFALHNLDTVSREQLFKAHQRYGALVDGAASPNRFAQPRDPARKLRLALLSPDLREHSCAYFLEPLLQHLPRTDFEVYLYHDHFREDAVSVRLRGLAAVWRNIFGQPDAVVERAIRGDAPDIVIDLAGHTGLSNRLPLVARRLAPVQVTYLGYPNTTGVAAIDYRFTDAIADPPGEADTFATEKLIRFAPTAWCYRAPAAAPEVSESPCRRNGHVTFGCFNDLGKISDRTLALWSRIFARVPQARLLLKGRGLGAGPVRTALIDRMEPAGIPAERVELIERTADTRTHLELYARIDVALDTFPYHGTTTTCEALWMGVPVVSLAGDRHVSRVGASLLTAVGRAEWIARNDEDYVRIAAELAEQCGRATDARRQLQRSVANSILCDEPGQAGRFARALREGWRAWCGSAAGFSPPSGQTDPANHR